MPLLVLCTARPELYERRPGWGAGQRNAHTINLSPLSDQETAELVSHLVSTAASARSSSKPSSSGPAAIRSTRRSSCACSRTVALTSDETVLPESVQALIAARLDTLAPERKSLLQDAAVLGKVFWVGALAEIGGREQRELELDLHDLVLKELVRPARTSSMEGENEYSFWHLLVRDVAYSPDPAGGTGAAPPLRCRVDRAKGGERVEDLAEVLASPLPGGGRACRGRW